MRAAVSAYFGLSNIEVIDGRLVFITRRLRDKKNY